MEWSDTHNGSRSERYEIELLAPHDWALSINGRVSSHHPTASSARATASRLEGRRRKRSALLFHGGLFVAVSIALMLVLPLRRQTNPAYEPAVDLTTEMQAAHDGVFAGGLLPTESYGASLLFESAIVPRNEVDLTVLFGTAANDCYVMYWAPDTPPKAGALVSSLECEPEAVLATSIEVNYQRFTPTVSHLFGNAPTSFDWDQVLPSPTRLPVWYFPAAIGLAVLLLRSLISLTLVILGSSL